MSEKISFNPGLEHYRTNPDHIIAEIAAIKTDLDVYHRYITRGKFNEAAQVLEEARELFIHVQVIIKQLGGIEAINVILLEKGFTASQISLDDLAFPEIEALISSKA